MSFSLGRCASDRRRCRPWARAARGAALVVAAVAQPVGLAGAQGPPYTLRLGDEVGLSSRYRIAFEIEMRARYRSDAEPDERTRRMMELLADGMVLRTALEYEQSLTGVDEDEARVFEVRWHGYDLDGEIGGTPVPKPPGHAESKRELLRHTARLRVTPTGRTLEIEHGSPRLAAIARSYESLEASMPTYLPERPVRVGDTWTGVARFPVGNPGSGGMGSLELELRHELAEVRQGAGGPIAVIRVSGSYSRLQGLDQISPGIPMHVEAVLTGSTEFDIRRGRFTAGSYEIDMLALQADEGVEVELTGHAQGGLKLLSER